MLFLNSMSLMTRYICLCGLQAVFGHFFVEGGGELCA